MIRKNLLLCKIPGLANGTYDVDVVYTIGGVTFTQTVAVTLS